jgi:hypothetical protein
MSIYPCDQDHETLLVLLVRTRQHGWGHAHLTMTQSMIIGWLRHVVQALP